MRRLTACTTLALACMVMVGLVQAPSTPASPPTDQRSSPLQLAQNQVSNVCHTPYKSCILGSYAPVGTACWCSSPSGPIRGQVR
jgi:hypothetical protein